MNATSTERKEYLLFTHAVEANGMPSWRFALEAVHPEAAVQTLEATDCEPSARQDRLELMAVVRGLEALEEPARVTLLTPSRAIATSLGQGLDDWREQGWQWELYGELVPLKNADLWQRVDRALRFHEVEARVWRADAATLTVGDQHVEEKAVLQGPHWNRRRTAVSRCAEAAPRAERIASKLAAGGPDNPKLLGKTSSHFAAFAGRLQAKLADFCRTLAAEWADAVEILLAAILRWTRPN